MTDLIVRLYDLPEAAPPLEALRGEGITVRRAMAYERGTVVSWVREHFGEGWADECSCAFGPPPVTCMLAVRSGDILGFACFECTCRNFFGPTGVLPQERGRGVGAALLLAALHAMAASGYAYAIIGGAGEDSIAFYEKVVGGTAIAGSVPGVYRDRLRRERPAGGGGP